LAAEQPLRIGLDARELRGQATGTGRYLRNLLRHWTAGADLFFAYFDGPPPPDPVLLHSRIKIRSVGGGRVRGVIWQERRLPAAAREDGLDVFFSPAYSCPLSLDRPRVTAVHDLSFFSHPQDFAYLDGLRRRLLVAASLEASRSVLACSEFTKREIGFRFPSIADRVRHVPLGTGEDLAPAPPREDARRQLGIVGPFVLTVGSVFNRRCLPELLRAWRRLGGTAILDVVGENRTSPRLDLPALVNELGLARHVRLSGFVDEAGLALRYAAADAAVFLSEYEGFGLPALEAAARGVPLLVSRHPSLGEVFGRAALVVDPRDEAAIAAGLARLLEDTGLRRVLTAAGAGLARAHPWSRTAQQTLDALRQAAEE
jgi:glycosyltransferase involved in cell wall biosynthesis